MLEPEYGPGPAGLAPLEPGMDPPDIKFTPEPTGTPYWGATPGKDWRKSGRFQRAAVSDRTPEAHLDSPLGCKTF